MAISPVWMQVLKTATFAHTSQVAHLLDLRKAIHL